MWSSALYRTVLIVAASTVANTKELEIPTNDPDALSLAVKQVSNGVFTFYNNDNTGIGLFPEPYDWSQSGAAWDSLVNYWYLTGDTSHNAATQAALSAQIGPDDNYLVPNQTISEGNENRTVWGLAALTAAERNFPQADGQGSSWEDLARNVFDGLAPRWDTQSCGGGLRSQIFTFNSGYNWKNSASQALFFQLAARLAHFTGNQTYVYWASRTYNWTRDAGLIGDDFAVYDGASANDNCSNVSGEQWSYTAASFAYGSAVLANFTSDSQWTDRTTSHLSNLLGTFFPSNILTEPLCDPYNNCTTHQLTTRALTLRYLSLLPFYVPSTHDQVWPALNTSAAAAATRCTVADGTGDSARAGCRGRWNASTTSSPSSSPSRSSTSTFSAATATATSDHSVSDGDFDSDNDGRPDDWDTIDDNPYDVGNNNHTSPPSSSNNSNDHDDNNNDDNDDDNPPGTGDDTWGLGQQLAALEVLQSKYVITADGVNSSFALRSANGTTGEGSGSGGLGGLGGSGGSGTSTGGSESDSGGSGSGSGSSGNGTGSGGGSSGAAASVMCGLRAASSWGLVVVAVVMGACVL